MGNGGEAEPVGARRPDPPPPPAVTIPDLAADTPVKPTAAEAVVPGSPVKLALEEAPAMDKAQARKVAWE